MNRFPRIIVVVAAAALAVAGCKGLDRSSSASGEAAGSSQLAPAVSFKTLDGGTLELASFKGKVVLLNFWATWCEPCQEEIPWLIEFQQKYGPKGFTVLGAAMDDDGAKVVPPFVASHTFDVNGAKLPMSYPIVLGSDAITDKFGGLIGLPTSILIDRDGRVVHRFLGEISREQLDDQIRKLL